MSAANGETENATGLLDSDASMQQYLDILKDSSPSSANLSTVRSLAMKVFAHPKIFCGFDEFKSHSMPLLLPGENSSHSSSPGRSIFNTLDLFSFGTVKDFIDHQEAADFYLPLNEAAIDKLTQLTVLTCIQKACFDGEMSISYDSLAEALGSTSVVAMQDDSLSSSTATKITNSREIEEILIRCVYANVLKGKLCQKSRSFSWRGERVPVVLSRDVPSGQIPGLLSALEGLGQRLEDSEKDLAKTQEHVAQGLEEKAQYWKSVQSLKKNALEESHNKSTGNVGPSSGGGQLASRLFGGGRQGPGGSFSGQGSTGSAGRRSSKRSRGGMAGNLITEPGLRMM